MKSTPELVAEIIELKSQMLDLQNPQPTQRYLVSYGDFRCDIHTNKRDAIKCNQVATGGLGSVTEV